MEKEKNKHITKLPDDIEKIVVKGARTHNLKNISVEMPRNKDDAKPVPKVTCNRR